MKSIVLTISMIVALAITSSYGQQPIEYTDKVREADSLYQLNQFERAAVAYHQAFQLNQGRGLLEHRFIAAKAWTKAGYPDSAFSNLNRLEVVGREDDLGQFSDAAFFRSDRVLRNLQRFPEWDKLLNKLEENKRRRESGYNKYLIAVLDTILINDSKYRLALDSTIRKYGDSSAEAINLVRTINRYDSLNAATVSAILDEHGWLGKQTIGEAGNRTLFLVVQHADLAVQEKYVSLLEDAVKKGNAQPSQLALLTDRIAIRKGEKQIYGSQIGQDPETLKYFLLPLEDPANVDKRRKKVGLPPLAEYLRYWNIDFY